MSEVSGLLQGLEWVVLDDVSHWGIDSRTIDLAYTVRRRGVGVLRQGEGAGVWGVASPYLLGDREWEWGREEGEEGREK